MRTRNALILTIAEYVYDFDDTLDPVDSILKATAFVDGNEAIQEGLKNAPEFESKD